MMNSTARWLALLGAVGLVSGLHYATPPVHFILHALYQRLYYVPVILAAYWFGVRGGLVAAVASSIGYAPHIHTAWSHNPPYTVSQYAELLVFLALGVSVGLIASHERRLATRDREAAESLERANRELRESGEQLRRAERLSAPTRCPPPEQVEEQHPPLLRPEPKPRENVDDRHRDREKYQEGLQKQGHCMKDDGHDGCMPSRLESPGYAFLPRFQRYRASPKPAITPMIVVVAFRNFGTSAVIALAIDV